MDVSPLQSEDWLWKTKPAAKQGKGHPAPLPDPQTNRGLFCSMQVKEHNTQWVKTVLTCRAEETSTEESGTILVEDRTAQQSLSPSQQVPSPEFAAPFTHALAGTQPQLTDSGSPKGWSHSRAEGGLPAGG